MKVIKSTRSCIIIEDEDKEAYFSGEGTQNCFYADYVSMRCLPPHDNEVITKSTKDAFIKKFLSQYEGFPICFD